MLLEHVGIRGAIENAHGLEGEIDPPVGEIVPQCPREAQFHAGLVLLEVTAEVLDLTVVQVHGKTQFAVEKIRLLECDLVILPARAGGDLQAEFLPAPSEVRWIEQVEVALHEAYLGKYRLDGTVPKTHDEMARPTFLNPDDEVAAVG